MTEAIRQRATVQPGGRLALQSNELLAGESVEVIVMAERLAANDVTARLATLDELRTLLNLEVVSAEKWAGKNFAPSVVHPAALQAIHDSAGHQLFDSPVDQQHPASKPAHFVGS